MTEFERRPTDQDVRDRVTGDLATTYLLEAGAGTGKTRVLVDRYVRCVLDPERGAGDVRQVAAITFTEKAAGELRQRIREEFEAREVTAAPGSAEAAAVRRALDALDDAPISTIHGFAGRLLRESPVEAGVDPAFEQMDELAAEIARARLWEEWLTALAGSAEDDSPAGPVRMWLSRLLRAGVRLDAVRELATGPKGVFRERYDIDPVGDAPPEPDIAAMVRELGEPLRDLERYCVAACKTPDDTGRLAADELSEACRKLLDDPSADIDRLAAALFHDLSVKSAPGGDKRNWDDAQGGKDGLVRRYRAVGRIVDAAREAYASYLTELALAVADAFGRWAGATQVAQGRLDFTDLLGRLRDLLAGDRDARRALQQRFRYILVDEFQDTDPVQWQILELAFHGHSTLVLIGDPKQSIYAFRGADVAAYARAVAQADDRQGLTVNHRSDRPVVAAVDALFAGVRLGPGIDVPHVTAAHPGSRLVLPPGSPWRSPVRLRVAVGDPFLTPEQARRRIAADLVAQVRGLLEPGAARLATDDGQRDLRPGDIAVLVRTNRRGRTLAQHLSAAGVAVAFTGSNSIFGSEAARDWLTLLRALDQPRRSAVRSALLTDFVGATLDDLARADEDAFADWAAMIHRWARVQRTAGIAGLFATIEQDTGLAERVLSRHLGERDLTDARHVAQLLHEQSLGGLTGGALADWLEAEMTAPDSTGERTRRLETDAEAVQIMTVHRAKGLQFPIVLVPEASDRLIPKDSGDKLVYHDPEGVRLLDLSGLHAPGREQRRAAQLAEEAADSLRTLYVSVTRAQSQVTLWWARTRYRTAASPLHRMLFRRRDLTGEPDESYPVDRPPGDAHPGTLDWLAPAGIAVEDLTVTTAPSGSSAAGEPTSLAARQWRRSIDTHWRRTSYSGLTATVHGQPPVGAVDDEPVPDAAAPDQDGLAGAFPAADGVLSPMAALPGGAIFGTAVHGVLESLDWYAPEVAEQDALRDRLAAAAAETLRRHPLGDVSAAALAEALLPSLVTPLGAWAQGRCLADIPVADRLSELAFEMPLGAPHATPTLGDIAGLLRHHLPPDDPLSAYPQALQADGLTEQTLRGFLTGSIDAVLRLRTPLGDERFVVVDYKTNRLSPQAELRLDHYRQGPMAAEMIRCHYPLQALLYQVALHRFLTQRLPGYRPDDHLGGATYLFVRGMGGRDPAIDGGLPTGVFHWRPPTALVTGVSRLLAERGAR